MTDKPPTDKDGNPIKLIPQTSSVQGNYYLKWLDLIKQNLNPSMEDFKCELQFLH